MKKIRIGSRESKLAIVQSEIFINELKRHYPDYEYVLVPMKTAGDRMF
jgi:hydroxymethylbilane synthase